MKRKPRGRPKLYGKAVLLKLTPIMARRLDEAVKPGQTRVEYIRKAIAFALAYHAGLR
jgi:hypothetical protein